MLFRLVSPVKRSGTENRQFVKRIPRDVRSKAIGRSFVVALSDTESVTVAISSKSESVRFSFRTNSPAEAKIRQARAVIALETIWEELRASAPVALTHRQATALSGRLYRAWADEQTSRLTVAVHAPTPDNPRAFKIVPPSHDDEITLYEGALRLFEEGNPEAPRVKLFRVQLGGLADRILLEEGIASVTPEALDMLITEFRRALRDALKHKRRNVGGDYSPDPRSERFPEWVHPKTATKQASSTDKASLTKLVEDWWKGNPPAFNGARS